MDTTPGALARYVDLSKPTFHENLGAKIVISDQQLLLQRSQSTSLDTFHPTSLPILSLLEELRRRRLAGEVAGHDYDHGPQ
jgi:hypothetical protein